MVCSEVNNKKITQAVIPATVTINETAYKVTGIADNAFKSSSKLKKVTIGKNITKIGKNAFAGCSKLKTITIKSEKIKSIGKKAVSKINKKAVIYVPKNKYKAYKKMLKKAGLPKSAKIKKIN